MAQEQTTVVANATRSEAGVSEIQSLIARAGELGRGADWWNALMLWALVFTAIAAIAVVLTTRMALRRAKQLSEVQGRIIELKDSQLLLDLKEKNQKIAEAGATASAAETKAEGFRLDIAKANENTAKLENNAAAAKLETEKLKLVVAWRIIQPEAAAKLEKLLSGKPGSVNLRYTDGDPEALYLAIQISQILGNAKWQVAPGAEKFANAIQFGIALPDSAGADAQTLRFAFEAAKIPFSTGSLPHEGISFSVSTIAGAPTLMIGSRMPVHIP
jgi:hypothetical protein